MIPTTTQRKTLPEIADQFSGRPCPCSAGQLDLLLRLAEGKKCKEIARELDETAACIYSRLYEIRSALDVVDRAQAVIVAFLCGWIVVDSEVAGGSPDVV